jgi:hypothetical protein
VLAGGTGAAPVSDQAQVLVEGRVRCQPRGEDADEDEEPHQSEADEGAWVLPQAPPRIAPQTAASGVTLELVCLDLRDAHVNSP